MVRTRLDKAIESTICANDGGQGSAIDGKAKLANEALENSANSFLMPGVTDDWNKSLQQAQFSEREYQASLDYLQNMLSGDNKKKLCHGFAVVSVPYMTAREPRIKDGHVIDFINKASEQVHYGKVDVLVPLTEDMFDLRMTSPLPGWTAKAGKCDQPAIGLPLDLGSEDQFLAELKSQFNKAPVKDLVFIEPGFHTSFQDAVIAAAQLKARGIPVVLNSWPSAESLFGYGTDAWNVRIDMNGHTSDTLEHISKMIGAGNMSLLGFSMGAYEMDEYLNLRSKISNQLPRELPRFQHAFLVHADGPVAVTSSHLGSVAANAGEVNYFGAQDDGALKTNMKLHGGILPTGLAGQAIFAKGNPPPNVRYYDDGAYQHGPFKHDIIMKLIADKIKHGDFGPDVRQTDLSHGQGNYLKLEPVALSEIPALRGQRGN